MTIGLTGLFLIPALLNGVTVNTSSQSDYSETMTQSESVFEYTPEYGTGGPINGDLYECNENTLTATRLFPENFNELEAYNTSFNATLCFECDSGDIDYYCLSLLTESIVTLTITETGENIYPFTFTTEKYVYFSPDHESENLYKGFEMIPSFSEREEFNKREGNYSDVLQAGTYFFCLANMNGYGTYPYVAYHFNLTVQKYSLHHSNQSISELRYDKKLKGALWFSDFRPLQLQDWIDPSLNLVYYDYLNSSLLKKDYPLDRLLELSNGEPVRLATYYIWDDVLIKTLSKMAAATVKQFSKGLQSKEIKQARVHAILDAVNKSITIAGDVIGVLNELSVINFSVGIEEELAVQATQEIVNYCCDILFLYDAFKETQFIDYLKSLSILGENPDLFSKALVLPIYYRLSTEHHLLEEKHRIDLTTTMNMFFEEENHYKELADIDFVQSDDPESYSTRGKLYGIDFSEDGELTFTLADQCRFAEINPEPLFLRYGTSIDHIGYRESYWFSFTAPETGNYSFHTNPSKKRHDDNEIKEEITIFTAVDYSWDSTDAVCSVHGGFYDNNHKEFGCYYQTSMEQGEILYFRISGRGGREVDYIVNFAAVDNFDDFIPHTHNYTEKYVWSSYTAHKSFCSCGEYAVQGHVVTGSSSLTSQYQTCMLCKGKAKMGFVVGPSLVSTVSSSGNSIVKEKDGLYYPERSYAYEGNLILSYQDSMAFKASMNL